MHKKGLLSLREVAHELEISEALINKFIRTGLIKPVWQGKVKKITPYGLRRLMLILDMYEKSFSTENIEKALNY